MANNITAKNSDGTSYTFATDDVAGVHYSYVKPAYGADDTATIVTIANGLPVQPATGAEWVLGDSAAVIGAVTQSGTWTITNAALTSIAGDYNANGGISVLVLGTANVSGTVAANVSGNVGLIPVASGGLSMSKTISAASTNATSVKAVAGQVYGIQVFNTNAAPRYLKLYNKASAPTVGTDTPVKVITIPGNAAGAGAAIDFPNGLAFGTGIAFALTTGAADTDATGVAASEIVVNIDYK